MTAPKKKTTEETPPPAAGEPVEGEGPEPTEPVAGAAGSEGQPAGEEQTATPVSPPPPSAPGPPAPPLDAQIEQAMRKVRDDERHQAEHEALAKATAPEPEKPKGFFDRLRWGS